MYIRLKLTLLFPTIALLMVSCGGNTELDKDTKGIADAMCKNIEVMNKLREADPADTTLTLKLQGDAKQVQIEMTILYQEFKDKYGDKAEDEKFNKDFSKKLRKFMLDCPHLSKKDREEFERQLESD